MDWRDRETWLQIGAFCFVSLLVLRFAYVFLAVLFGL
jgi:hypothetical protein